MARATITEFWLGISMDVISSIEPEAETFGRCARPTTSAMSRMRLMPMATTLAGGKFLAAVPYSSLMSKLVPDSGVVDGAEGGVGATGGFSSGIGNPARDFTLHHAQMCFMAFANCCVGNVLRTSSRVSQARRACNMPYRILSRLAVCCESVL